MEFILKYFPELTEVQTSQFQQLEALYHDWNSKINVISRKDIDQLYVKHVLHSLAIAKIQKFEPGTYVLDVGTGGGLTATKPVTGSGAVAIVAKKNASTGILIVGQPKGNGTWVSLKAGLA